MNRATSRNGLSLLEVLISIFVISIGLMSLAMLIPAGTMAINEANKSDRSGACGRSAMRQIKIARMLDPNYWVGDPGNGPFAIDPLGKFRGMTGQLGGLQRIGLSSVTSLDVAEDIFVWQDDLAVVFPKDRSLRSYIEPDKITGKEASKGHYSWFMTVTPSPAEASLPWDLKCTFSVSVVVCHSRVFGQGGETPLTADFLGLGIGGGTIQLKKTLEKPIRSNQWIMLYDNTQCKWYRVVSAGAIPGAAQTLSLVGPDWLGGKSAQALIVQDVIGVYSTTVETDRNRNLIWKRVE